MASTVETKELFEDGTTETYVKEAQRLRLKAGAITCTYSGSQDDGWVMITTWNVIGEQ